MNRMAQHEESKVCGVEDDVGFIRIDYQQQLYRGMDGFMSFTLGFTEVSSIISITSIFGYGLSTGGPVMIFWGWLFTFAMTMMIALNFAEICSVFPYAGSVYHWAGVLAPRHWALHSAYWTGLFNWLGNCAGDASFAYIFAQMISSALSTGGTPALSRTQNVEIAIAVLLVWSLMNCLQIQSIGWVNNIASFIQAATIISLVVITLVIAPKLNSTKRAILQYNNDTGFDQTYYVIILGLLFPLYGFAGYDGPGHLAEETKRSGKSASMGIIYTVFATGTFGFVLIVALLLAMQDIDDAIGEESGNAAVQIILQCCGTRIASIFSWLLVVNIFFCGSCSVTVTSRIWFALCRDRATIFSEKLCAINSYFHSPINGIICLFFLTSLLLLLPLHSENGEAAFLDVVSLSVTSLQISYAIPIFMKVLCIIWPSNHGNISDKLSDGSFSLGFFSLPLGLVSCMWLFFTSLVLMMPTSYPIATNTMNFASVGVTGIILFGILNWEFNSKRIFVGPRRADNDYVIRGDFLDGSKKAQQQRATLNTSMRGDEEPTPEI